MGRRGLASLRRSQPSWTRGSGRRSGRGEIGPRPIANGWARPGGTAGGLGGGAPAAGAGPGQPRGRLRARAPGGRHGPSANWPPGSGRAGAGALASVPLKRRNQGGLWPCPRGPIESQRGCPTLPDAASPGRPANSKCPLVPPHTTPSGALEMRYTGSTRIEGSNPSRSAKSYRDVYKRQAGGRSTICPRWRWTTTGSSPTGSTGCAASSGGRTSASACSPSASRSVSYTHLQGIPAAGIQTSGEKSWS